MFSNCVLSKGPGYELSGLTGPAPPHPALEVGRPMERAEAESPGLRLGQPARELRVDTNRRGKKV